MSYLADFIKNLTRKSNAGIVIYLILNTLLITWVFSGGFSNPSGVLTGLLAYAVSLAVALSPVGEWILRWQTGCKEIRRADYLHRLQPLFQEVLAQAREVNPAIPQDVRLFMSDEAYPNAFATGRKTICLTRGFLSYSDEQIKATFAHELGHLANKDTDLILLVTIGNFIVTALFIIFRLFVRLVTICASIASESLGAVLMGFLIDGVLVFAIWGWTKLGTVLVMHSSRQNEYLADEFAFNCGYGQGLISTLHSFRGDGSRGLWANLAASHPESDNRIAKLQELMNN
ncbi:MAG: M48 family metalloprotease [Firmicutes bacterium]|nr:M48 family metalloprotease [Bacillota bacterium]